MKISEAYAAELYAWVTEHGALAEVKRQKLIQKHDELGVMNQKSLRTVEAEQSYWNTMAKLIYPYLKRDSI